MDFLAREEDIAIDGLIMIPRSNQHPVDTQTGNGLADLFNLLDIRLFENRGIGRNVITEPLTFFDHGDGFIEYTVAVANQIMGFAHAVEMNIDGQPFVGSNPAINLSV